MASYYVGERKWLSSKKVGFGMPYSDWVLAQLNEFVFPDGIVYDQQGANGRQWNGYTEDTSVFMLFEDLKCGAVRIDNVQLSIPGDFFAPAQSKLIHAFELLHNVAYYLHIVGARFHDEVFLDELIVNTEEGRWHMELINDFGSMGTIEFRDAQLVVC